MQIYLQPIVWLFIQKYFFCFYFSNMTFSGIRRNNLAVCLLFAMHSFFSDNDIGFLLYLLIQKQLQCTIFLPRFAFFNPPDTTAYSTFPVFHFCIMRILHVSSTRVFNIHLFHKHEISNFICQPAHKHHTNQLSTCFLQ